MGRWVRRQVVGVAATRKGSAEQRDRDAEMKARESFQTYWPDPLFVAGLSLYRGGGDKVGRYQVRFTNTDPELIYLFLKFLNAYTPEYKERIWISLIQYAGTNRETNEQFWQAKTMIPTEQFQKTVTIKSKSIERKSPHGICVVGVSSVSLKIKMMTWIAECAKRL